MKLRMVVGKDPAALQFGDSLKTLYQTPGVVIQGDGDVSPFKQEGARQAFLAGDLWGPLEGRFVLASVKEDGSLTLSTDRYGEMDLYIQKLDDAVVLATDLSLLLWSSPLQYDSVALVHTLSVYGYKPPKKHTLYQNVSRLGVGEQVFIKNGQMEIKETAFKPLCINQNYGERELHQYADTLLSAVALRGSPNGNVIYLSSGWDSTALLACLVKTFGSKKVRAVTGRMLYAERSGIINQFEIDRAKAVADYFKVQLNIVDLDYRSNAPAFAKELSPLLKAHQLYSLPALNSAKLAQFVAATSNGEEMVFTGEISDGAHNLGFSQFTTIFHPVLEFREYSDKMASFLFGPTFLGLFESSEFSKEPIYQLLRSRCGDALFDEPAKDVVGRRQQLLASFFLRANRFPLWSLKNSRLLTEEGCQIYSAEAESIYLREAAQRLTKETLYSWMLHLYNSFHWQSATVATFAITARANGLKMALPFWDRRLQNFLSQMPESWGRGLDLNPTKYPLKWMLKNRIDYPLHLQVGPHSYLYDVDPNFSHTAEILYGSSFADYFRALLKNRHYENLLNPRHFSLDYIRQIVDGYLSGAEVRGLKMNDLLALSFLSMAGWYE